MSFVDVLRSRLPSGTSLDVMTLQSSRRLMVIVVVATTFISSPLLSLRKSFQRSTFSGSLYTVSTANRLNVETLKAGQNAESIARCKSMVPTLPPYHTTIPNHQDQEPSKLRHISATDGLVEVLGHERTRHLTRTHQPPSIHHTLSSLSISI